MHTRDCAINLWKKPQDTGQQVTRGEVLLIYRGATSTCRVRRCLDNGDIWFNTTGPCRKFWKRVDLLSGSQNGIMRRPQA